MAENPLVIHGTGGRLQCDQSQSDSVKQKENAMWADFSFHDKISVSQKLPMIRTNLDETISVSSPIDFDLKPDSDVQFRPC